MYPQTPPFQISKHASVPVQIICAVYSEILAPEQHPAEMMFKNHRLIDYV